MGIELLIRRSWVRSPPPSPHFKALSGPNKRLRGLFLFPCTAFTAYGLTRSGDGMPHITPYANPTPPAMPGKEFLICFPQE